MKTLNHEHEQRPANGFLISNGNTKNNQTPPPDIELITITPTSYTSLRDVITASSAATSALGGAMSPTAPDSPTSWKSSCRDDVSIRNPLVKQAALAYLQPWSSTAETDHRSWTEKIRANLNRCFAVDDDGEGAEQGCMSPLDGVVFAPIKEALGRILRAFSTEDHED